MLTRQLPDISPVPYAGNLPPPLCFTVPAGKQGQVSGGVVRWSGPAVTLRVPKLMMDPSNPSTWQRAYRFTS